MRKSLIGLLVALFIFSSVGLCYSQDEKPSYTLQMRSSTLKATIEQTPISLVDYFDFGLDFVSSVLVRLAKTTRPAWIFNGQPAVEVTAYENLELNLLKNKLIFDLTWGFCKDGSQYYGAQLRQFPLTGAFAEIFEKVHPQILYYKGDGGYFTLGICYKFRGE